MNTTPPNNPHAFPQSENWHDSEMQGMSLRDYFAAKALQTVLMKYPTGGDVFDLDKEKAYFIAFYAYQIADAMLKAKENIG